MTVKLMQKHAVVGAVVGLFLTIGLTAVSFLSEAMLGLPFVTFDFFDWLARNLPGGLLTFGIDALVKALTTLGFSVASTAKIAEGAMAVVIFLVLGTIIAAVTYAVRGRIRNSDDQMLGFTIGAFFGLPMLLISSSISQPGLIAAIWLLGLFLGWGLLLTTLYHRLFPPRLETAEISERRLTTEAIDRRRFLIRLGGTTAAITVVGAGLGGVLAASEQRRRDVTATTGPLPNEDAGLTPAPGTRDEYTPLDDHYRIDINLTPLSVNGLTWTLPITGMVENAKTLTMNNLRHNYEPMDQYITLTCISNQVGGDLIGTLRWTGVSLQQIMADVQPMPNAGYLRISSADGFFEVLSLDLIDQDERIMLAYDWDGQPLLDKHGFPLRVYIPDRYGMKQPKWITKIEVIASDEPGYWVIRGWDKQAIVRTQSVIDTVIRSENAGDENMVSVGGIAFAGARGISRVEIKVDQEEWQEAELRQPMSDLAWTIWRYEWPFQSGSHTFRVRAYDGNGDMQISSVNPPHPSGATGIHTFNKRL